MELQEAIRTRRSMRAFLPNPVSEDTIRQIINDAIWSPSWANTQPWEIVVVTGDTLQQFKKENRQALLEGETSMPDISIPKDWPDKNSPMNNFERKRGKIEEFVRWIK